MNKLGIAVAAFADLGAAAGGWLGGLGELGITQALDTRPEAEASRTRVANEYDPSDLKTAALVAVDDLIAEYAIGN